MKKQKSPRIVMYLTSFPKTSETFIVNKFVGLLEKGWDLHIVCAESSAREWKNFPALENRMRRRVHVGWRHRPRWLAGLLTPIALLRCLLNSPRAAFEYLSRGWKIFRLDILRRLYLDAEIILLKPDLIHFEFGALAAERMYLKDLLKCKILVSFRGYDLNFTEADDPHFYMPVWQNADMLHLLSEHLWQVAQERGCPSHKVHVLIPPAVDTDLFTKKSGGQVLENERPLQVLSVGRLEWKKGYEYALQAVKLLADQGIPCEYRIIGDGAYLEAISFARHQLELEDAVTLLGAQPAAGVKTEMEQADIFLHPSLSEGFCNVVIEAQSMSLPVVASDAGGLKENVETNITGFIIPRRNPQALAEKMAILARDPALRKQMGEAGRRRVLEHFQISEQIRRFEETYSQLLNIE